MAETFSISCFCESSFSGYLEWNPIERLSFLLQAFTFSLRTGILESMVIYVRKEPLHTNLQPMQHGCMS